MFVGAWHGIDTSICFKVERTGFPSHGKLWHASFGVDVLHPLYTPKAPRRIYYPRPRTAEQVCDMPRWHSLYWEHKVCVTRLEPNCRFATVVKVMDRTHFRSKEKKKGETTTWRAFNLCLRLKGRDDPYVASNKNEIERGKKRWYDPRSWMTKSDVATCSTRVVCYEWHMTCRLLCSRLQLSVTLTST